MNFDYYYGDESNQFAFYRIPRQLITGEAFKKLSTDAKLLYGLLLDRMGLSAKNGWYDDTMWREAPAGGNSGAITIIPSCSGADGNCLSAKINRIT